MKKAVLLAFIFSCFISCGDDAKYDPIDTGDNPIIDLPGTPYNYTNLNLPTYFQNSVAGTDNTPSRNPITDAGATLGRVLFYDTHLSRNETVACGSCHRQDLAFSDSPVRSLGFDFVPTRRHSISLVNQRYYARGRFFWDERASTLENQVLQPIMDVHEMGLTSNEITQRIAARPFYSPLFQAAFGTGTITNERIADALSQFIRSIVSFQSRYDEGRGQVADRMLPFPNFTEAENQGKDLFMKPVAEGGAGCFQCHATEAFVSVNSGPKNNGLDLTSTNDFGAYETFPGIADFKGAFKIPTLRNLTQTAPYMHDGRFSTLQQVIEHYNSGVQNHPNLSPQLKDTNGNPQRLNLTDTQKAALLAFLRTLTDQNVMHNTKWSDPFINQHL